MIAWHFRGTKAGGWGLDYRSARVWHLVAPACGTPVAGARGTPRGTRSSMIIARSRSTHAQPYARTYAPDPQRRTGGRHAPTLSSQEEGRTAPERAPALPDLQRCQAGAGPAEPEGPMDHLPTVQGEGEHLMWRCVRQLRPAVGPGRSVVVPDPRVWLDQHTDDLLARPDARLWGYAGEGEAVRRTLAFVEGAAVSDRRSLQRVIRVGDETITLTAEPA